MTSDPAQPASSFNKTSRRGRAVCWIDKALESSDVVVGDSRPAAGRSHCCYSHPPRPLRFNYANPSDTRASGPPPATTYHRISIDRLSVVVCRVRHRAAGPGHDDLSIVSNAYNCPQHEYSTHTAPNTPAQSDQFSSSILTRTKRCTP